jgi:hypothetical protein
MFKVKTEVEVSPQTISDTLCSAFEGGSNYWYRIEKMHPPKNFKNTPREDDRRFKHLSYPINEGGFLTISNAMLGDELQDDAERLTKVLNIESIQKGLQVMAEKYPRHFNDMIQDSGDAITGDVFLQCCLFGEIIYG